MYVTLLVVLAITWALYRYERKLQEALLDAWANMHNEVTLNWAEAVKTGRELERKNGEWKRQCIKLVAKNKEDTEALDKQIKSLKYSNAAYKGLKKRRAKMFDSVEIEQLTDGGFFCVCEGKAYYYSTPAQPTKKKAIKEFEKIYYCDLEGCLDEKI